MVAVMASIGVAVVTVQDVRMRIIAPVNLNIKPLPPLLPPPLPPPLRHRHHLTPPGPINHL